MRTKLEIINDINSTQTLYDRLLMDIGLLSAKCFTTKDKFLVATTNEKIEAFKKVELQLHELEKELVNADK